MLARGQRMRDGQEFRHTIRRGAKAATPTLVVHVVPGAGSGQGTSAGFVVSKAVGGAVVRNRVKRRLRHLVRDRLGAVPDGSRIVVRALPPAASADDLAHDLESALERAFTRAGASA